MQAWEEWIQSTYKYIRKHTWFSFDICESRVANCCASVTTLARDSVSSCGPNPWFYLFIHFLMKAEILSPLKEKEAYNPPYGGGKNPKKWPVFNLLIVSSRSQIKKNPNPQCITWKKTLMIYCMGVNHYFLNA